MSIKRLFAIVFIAACTTGCWFLLAGAVVFRSKSSASELTEEVGKNWGPVLAQEQPVIYYEAPTRGMPMREILPQHTNIAVRLNYDPKRKGLLWYRTYFVDFKAEYLIKNPTPIAQTVYAIYRFPEKEGRYDAFALTFGGKATENPPVNGEIRDSVRLEAGQEATLTVTYRAPGMNEWSYVFHHGSRVQDFHLAMATNFMEIDIPAKAESPTTRTQTADGWMLDWDYTDVLGGSAIAMAMPKVTNPGEVAGRMTIFAPVSLLFFFSVLVIVAIRNRTDLHPMNYFFLAAGCFAFQLVFAYLADLLPLTAAFLIAAGVSLLLVNGYLWRAAGPRFAAISATAQLAFMVLFSYSFFFDGLTGITITTGAVVTLALLMASTAKVNWNESFPARRLPKPRVLA